MVQPLISSPNEGESFTVGALRILSRVQAGQSGGGFELYDLFLGPFTIDYHVHRTMDETLTVLEGQIEFIVAGETFVRGPGSVAFVPRGVHHGFSNRGPAQARVLALFTPSGRQSEYFRALEKLAAAPSPDMAAIHALQKQYDQELIAPGT
jgi:mannose-6-phosphate isomerase-like protein (cupin superfamily)